MRDVENIGARVNSALRDQGCKWCPDCQAPAPLANFRRNRSQPDGLQSYCKVHQTERDKDRRNRHATDTATRLLDTTTWEDHA